MWLSAKVLRLTAIAVLAVLLAGCGFQLRESVELPPELRVLTLDASPLSRNFAIELRRAVEAAGGEVTEDPHRTVATLKVLNEGVARRIASIGAGGTVREFELRYTVSFEVRDASGRVMLPQEELITTRVYGHEAELVQAKSREEQELEHAMQQELAARVVRRLRAAAAMPKESDANQSRTAPPAP